MWREDSTGNFAWLGAAAAAGKTLSHNLGLQQHLDKLLTALPPSLVRRSKRLLCWQGLIVGLLFVHALWVVAYLHTMGPGGIGMPLPGIQPWARLDKVAESRQQAPGDAGATMGRQLSAAAAPVRTCPVDVEWGNLPKDPNKGRAAVFTLYNIVFGGGERYLLSIVLVLQGMGYHVDVMVLQGNLCTSREFLMSTAEGLRIRLDPAKLDVMVVGKQGTQLQVQQDLYSVFFSLGNEKAPQVSSIGYTSFFMNQFPFDAYDTVKPIEMEALSTYDYVLLNSQFSYRWWHTYVTDGLYYPTLQKYGVMPLVEILHPPVDPFPPSSLDDIGAAQKRQQQKRQSGALFSGDASSLLASFSSIQARSEVVVEHDLFAPGLHERAGGGTGGSGASGAGNRRHIAVVGRFFEGRQSKGHNEAVEMFRTILPQLPNGTELHLVGNLMGGLQHSTYLFKVMQRSVGLPVKFHVGVSSKDVEDVLHTTLVQWHLTGIGLVPGEDPASEEHFGISVAEGMSAGCIPVVLLRGGVGDIVQHGVNGFLGPEIPQMANLTLQVFSMNATQQTALRTRAIRDVARFTHTTFAKKFKDMIFRAAYSKPLRHLVKETRDVVTSRWFKLPHESSNVAILLQPDRHYAFEYIVKNVMFHLTSTGNPTGDPWSLIIVHGHDNRNYIQRTTKGIEGVQLWETADPASLLASPSFWQRLNAKHALVFSTDSLLLKGNLKEYLEYDYAAAPPCATPDPNGGPHGGSSILASLEADLYPKQGHGLGTLSLRSVAAMRDLSQQMHNTTQASVNEPTLAIPALGALLDRVAGLTYSVPAPGTAYHFAVEAPCPALDKNFTVPYGHPLHTLPFVPTGLSGTWYHFWGDGKRYRDLLKLLAMSVCGYAQ